MNKRKISYNKTYNNENGTIYNQGITITEKEFDHINASIQCKRALGVKYLSDNDFMYLNGLHLINNKIAFSNNTTSKFIFEKLKIKSKRLKFNRNTYFLIK